MADWIHLDGLEVQCLLGLHEHEQRFEQPVTVDASIELDLDAAIAGDLRETIDYDALALSIAFVVRRGRWRLIETAAGAIVRMLLTEGTGRVGRARVRVSKPQALGGRAVPRVEMTRERAVVPVRERDGVQIVALVETATMGAYRLSLAPGVTWELREGSASLLIDGAVRGTRAEYGPSAEIAPGTETALRNESERAVELLVIGRPLLGSV